MKLIEIKHRKYGKEYVKRGAYIFSIKKNGQRSKYATWYEAYGDEKTQEDVMARLQRLNPNARYELA